MFVGTLIYAVVLGFFNDYTSIVDATSFSTIFFAAIVLEMLTFGAFFVKGQIVTRLRVRSGAANRLLMFFCVWLVMFLSKFVFIWTIDLTFGDEININGFFGILLVALTVTVVHKLADYAFAVLGDERVRQGACFHQAITYRASDVTRPPRTHSTTE